MSAVKPRGVCLVVLLLALATGCGKPVAGEPRAADNPVRTTSKTTTTSSRKPTTPTRPSTSGKPSTSDVFNGRVGMWEGEYTCGQGNTGLRLDIKPPQGDALPAIFMFFPLPSNPSAKVGSYTMKGQRSASGQLVFKQQQWIAQPAGYVMVDIAVTSPLSADATQLSGDVLMNLCKGFSVRRS